MNRKKWLSVFLSAVLAGNLCGISSVQASEPGNVINIETEGSMVLETGNGSAGLPEEAELEAEKGVFSTDSMIGEGKEPGEPEGADTFFDPGNIWEAGSGEFTEGEEFTDGAAEASEDEQALGYDGSGEMKTVGDFTVAGDGVTEGTDYTYENNTLTIKSSKAITISGASDTTTTQDKIVVDSSCTEDNPANIILDNVKINVEDGCAFWIQENAAANLTLQGENTLKSGMHYAGLQVPQNSALVITDTGSGSLEAQGGKWGAGIGGGERESGGSITINGGMVSATGGEHGAGIGGGFEGASRSITINGGTVSAQGGDYGAGIGGGYYGTGGTLSSGASGNAWIETSSVNAAVENSFTSGVIFEGTSGKVYGNVTLDINVEIPEDCTLTIPEGTTLTVPNSVTINNKGTIDNQGKIDNEGTLTNNGILENYGTISGSVVNDGGTVRNATTVTVKISKDGSEKDSVSYGDTITITVEVAERTNNTLSRNAENGTVDFYLGTVEKGTKLNSGDVGVVDNKAELELTLSGDTWTNDNWKINENIITAKFSGTSNLLDSIGTVTLTVDKAEQSPTAVSVSPKDVTYGSTAPTITPLTVKENAIVSYSAVTAPDSSGNPSDVAEINGTTITLKKAGSFYVKADIGETAHYAEKTVYSQMITVNERPYTPPSVLPTPSPTPAPPTPTPEPPAPTPTPDSGRPSTPVIANARPSGNSVRITLEGVSAGAQGYDFVISENKNCIVDKDYRQVNKNCLLADTTFRYIPQGTYYVYCHSWTRGEDNKKIFSKWSEPLEVVVSETTPETPKITGVSSPKKGVVEVNVSVPEGADGYDIILGKSVRKVNGEKRPVDYGENVLKNRSPKTRKVVFRNVKAGTYYIALHSYTRSEENNTKVFSKWSSYKKVKVK